MSLRQAAATVGALLALGACGVTSSQGDAVAPVEIDVYAAASLTDVFTALATEFEETHSGVDVLLTFGGSSDLASRIAEGAPADVFASADEQQMNVVSGLAAGTPTVFATNVLTIAVPTGNPAGITGFASLGEPGLVVVTCAPEVPCGAATAALEERFSIDLLPASEEPSVTDVLGKVASGEADAGLVFVTDIARAEGVEQVAIEGAGAASSSYFIAAIADSDAGTSADDFVAFVLGDRGQALLAEAGFRAP